MLSHDTRCVAYPVSALLPTRPNLPDEVINISSEQVGNPDWFTSGDIDPVCRCPRMLVREHRLDKNSAAEELLKLCLEIGLGASFAQWVRKSAKESTTVNGFSEARNAPKSYSPDVNLPSTVDDRFR